MEELDRINQYIDLVGINNRNLKDFSVDINHSINLAAHVPDTFTKIAESGISNAETLICLKRNGFNGFLIGEKFMQSSRPELACKDFINEIRKLTRAQNLRIPC
jgi:indole-3-glycerol phosphate synthase